MATHRWHPARGEPNAVLFDDCPRCDEQADRPDSLDDASLARLLNLREAHTDNEARALRTIAWATELTRRAAAVSPLAVR